MTINVEVPTRFVIKDRPTRPMRALPLLWRADWTGQPTRDELRELVPLLSMGDPLADDVARWARDIGFGQARLVIDAALDNGLDDLTGLPAEVGRLLSSVSAAPSWLDRELLELGARTARRTGILGHLILRNVSLMGGYANAAISKPLVFTGALNDGAYKRIFETRSYWIDCISPGGMDPDGPGFRATLQVRILHGFIRLHLSDRDDWETHNWGTPLNQYDMLTTYLAYTVAFMSAARGFGFVLSRQEREGLVHLWRYITWVIGLDERLLPVDVTSSVRAMYGILATMPGPDQDTLALARGLMNEPLTGRVTRTDRFRGHSKILLHSGVTRFFHGRTTYRELGLPGLRHAAFAIPVVTVLNLLILEPLRLILPGGTNLWARLGQRQLERWRVRRGGAPEFAPKDETPQGHSRSAAGAHQR